MKLYNIILHRRIFEMTATIRNIPIRLYISAKNKLLMLQRNVKATLTKLTSLNGQKVTLQSFCKTAMTLFTRTTICKTELLSKITAIQSKINFAGANHALLLQNPPLSVSLTMYRKLADMDTNEGTKLMLFEFDNMGLENIDYIEF